MPLGQSVEMKLGCNGTVGGVTCSDVTVTSVTVENGASDHVTVCTVAVRNATLGTVKVLCASSRVGLTPT